MHRSNQVLSRTIIISLSIAVLVAVAAGPGFGLTVRSSHPRMFVLPEDLPKVRARCAIPDGNNQAQYPNEWSTHLDLYEQLTGMVDDYPSTIPVWDTAANGTKMANLATMYLLNSHRSQGNSYREKFIEWWRGTLVYSRDRNGGIIGRILSGNGWGKDANWSYWTYAYDAVYNALSSDHALRDSISTLIGRQVEVAWDSPDYYEDPFYNAPWTSDGLLGACLAVKGDYGARAWNRIEQEFDDWLDHVHERKLEQNLARVLNYQGQYPMCGGYKNRRIKEDVTTALAWRTAVTDEDPFFEHADHFRQIDDAYLWRLRANFRESDCTGDGRLIGLVDDTQWLYTYPSASIDENGEALWVLDETEEQTTAASGNKEVWFRILFDDRSVQRVNPESSMQTNIKHFGDLTVEDGRTSEYTFIRSDWNFNVNDQNSVFLSFFCGPTLGCHEHGGSQGHLAIFRGDDVISAHAGLYDRPENRHSKRYAAQTVSYNTILVADPDNPYIAGETDSLRYLMQLEGCQFEAERVNWESCHLNAPDKPFREDYIHGGVDRLEQLENGDTYLHADFTRAYPSPLAPNDWPDGATVENATRQVMLEAGTFVVVCDRVTSVNPNAVKRVRWHCPNPNSFVLIDGSWTGGTPPYTVIYGGTPGQWSTDAVRIRWDSWIDDVVGDSRMFGTILYPVPAASGGPGRKLVRVGGSNSSGEWNMGRTSGDKPCCDDHNDADNSYEFWLPEAEFNQKARARNCSGDCQTGTSGNTERSNGSYGFWVLDTEATGWKDHVFLHAFEITAKSQSQPTMIDYLDDVDAEHIGCEIQLAGTSRINVFSRDEEPDIQISYQSSLLTPIQHLIADLVPGLYLVEELTSGFTAQVTVRDQSNVASFETPSGGTFRVTRIAGGGDVARVVTAD